MNGKIQERSLVSNQRSNIRRGLLAPAAIAIALALGGAAQAQNTANNYTGSATGSVLVGSNWSLGHVPIVSEDAVFTATTGIRTMTAGNLTVGSWNVTAASGTFSLRNETATATDSILTLGGAGNLGNSVSGNASDLLYAATGSTFNIIGPNGGGGTGVLKIVLGQSGNFNIAGTSTISAAISGTGFGFTKTGAGTLTLSGVNTYSGGTTLSAGTLAVGTSTTALGGGTLTLSGGTLSSSSGGVTGIANPISVTASTTTTLLGGGGASYMLLSGDITGSGTLATSSGVRFSGNNSGFSGTVITPSGSPGVYLNNVNSGSASATWEVNGTFLSNVSGGTFNLGALTGASTGILRSGAGTGATFVIGGKNSNASYSGTIINGTGTVNVTKTGTGTQTLAGTNTYTGTTTISQGILEIGATGTHTAVTGGAYTINSGGTLLVNGSVTTTGAFNVAGTLGGTGTINANVTVTGTTAPGNSPGILNIVGDYTLDGGVLAIQLDGPTAGNGAGFHDQVNVTGAVSLLNTPTLSLAVTFASSSGNTYTIINNDLTDAVTGTSFAGLPQGAIFAADGRFFQISYLGGSGNDVVLTDFGAAVPEPTIALLLGLGGLLILRRRSR